MNINDNKILSHTTWNCKYHIVFAPKNRRKIFYESHRKEIMETLKELCRRKGVEILVGTIAADIYQKWGNIKFQRRNRVSGSCPGLNHDTKKHTPLWCVFFVVGLSRLELPTSRLSGACSNQLSYNPILVEVSGFEPLTPCLQSRCSTN